MDDPLRRRLSALQELIDLMWRVDPGERAQAVKAVASLLTHSDPAVAEKAARALVERGGVAFRYLQKAVHDQQLPEARRALLAPHEASSTDHLVVRDLVWAELPQRAEQVLSIALSELQHHAMSSLYIGRLPERGGLILRYLLDLDLAREADLQALMSFKYTDSTQRARDEHCIPVVKAFARNARYHQPELPTEIGLRYFAWRVQ